MKKDLTVSKIHRKNILNNQLVIDSIQKEIQFPGITYENKIYFTKKHVSDFFDIDERTVERYLEKHGEEIEDSGYLILSGANLKKFKEGFGPDIDVGTKIKGLNKTTVLGLFSFRALLNISMLLTESDRAKQLRSAILDIAIDAVNQKLGGSTKYINQREEDFLTTSLREYNYRKEFTDALDKYIVNSKFKYAILTNKVYQAIFKEDALEYKKILRLKPKDSVRSTLYSEVLDLVSSFESGYSNVLKKEYEIKGSRLTVFESEKLFQRFEEESAPMIKPIREKARSKMASRDLEFRDAFHENISEYIEPMSSEDFDKFLGEKSKDLKDRILENIDVFKRLKDR